MFVNWDQDLLYGRLGDENSFLGVANDIFGETPGKTRQPIGSRKQRESIIHAGHALITEDPQSVIGIFNSAGNLQCGSDRYPPRNRVT